MTVISFNERPAGSASTTLPESFAGRRFGLRWLFNVAAGFAERVHRNRMIAELQALDDRLLRDMGIARCEIWYRVHHPEER